MCYVELEKFLSLFKPSATMLSCMQDPNINVVSIAIVIVSQLPLC